jgi:hypothetical protein
VVQALAFAVMLNRVALLTMTSNRLIVFENPRCGATARASFRELSFRRNQLKQRLLDDDAKSADAQNESSDSSKGSGNCNDNK